MIDTHCHLTDPRLRDQLAAVLQRAADSHVRRLITIATDIDDSGEAVRLCDQLPNVRCAVGVHPNYSHTVAPEQLPLLRGLQAHPGVVAIGEIGLDYFHARADRKRQHDTFAWQLALAAEVGRPVVIHSREAIDDTLAHLGGFPNIRAVFHCFTGTMAEARRILDAGYLLGFTGPLTYKKSQELRDIVAMMPQDRLLVETDAPYLTPEPLRKQKVNEPALVRLVAEKAAEVRGVSIEQIDAITTANATRLFGWPD